MSGPLPQLRKYQLFQLARRLAAQSYNGLLSIEEPDGKTVLTFHRGTPVQAASTKVSLSFTAFLLRKRRVDRAGLKQLLEEAAERSLRLEELLVSKGIISSKEQIRLKRELSEYVFSMAFHVDRVPYTLVPGETSDDGGSRRQDHLDIHEALFRAVAADGGTTEMGRMFAGRWENSLVKSADFYRHLIQFRSVFYGEDITEQLMAGEPTAQDIVDGAEDRDSALRQLFALGFSGMLSLDTDAGTGTQANDQELGYDGEAAGSSENRTVVIMPEEPEATTVKTQFIGEGAAPFQSPREPIPEPVDDRPDDLKDFLAFGFSTPAPEELDEAAATEAPLDQSTAEANEAFAQTELSEPEPQPEVADSVPEMPLATPVPVPRKQGEEAMAEEEDDEEEELPVPLAEEDPPFPEPSGPPIPREPTTPMPVGTLARVVPDVVEPRPPGEDDNDVERLLQRAVEEAERVVAESNEVARTPAPAAKEYTDEELTSEPEEEELVDQTPLAHRDPPTMPPRPTAPDAGHDESIERILEDVYRGMSARTLYQLLNATPATPLSSIRDNAARLLNKYQASQYRAYMLSSRCEQILDYIGQEIRRARDVLTDRKERHLYDKRVGTDYGQELSAALGYLFDAETAFQAGLEAMRTNHWGDALVQFTKAAEANSRDPDYLAHKGWATYQALQSGHSDDSFAPTKARNILERALAVDGRHARAMLFLARIEKETGNLDSARLWFERLYKIDPGNDEVPAALEWIKLSSGVERKASGSGFWSWLKGIFQNK